MNTIDLNALANKIALICPVLLESVSEQTLILKGRIMPYRLYMKFTDNLPILQIDLYNYDLKNEIEDEVNHILTVYYIYMTENIQVSYLNLRY
ncbi:hypothetical protein [Pedobacter hartonius]|uniref:Uncharacterized protein n=1 Tax=Pedobacter hartonius TaxID=425514 RepID=A0A1H3W6N3_9SPHI|nr:hypothetical protein [Pedobacter hartonius]SDZ82737.1 hypothetical protein SAMN05443550_101120 [Pedobacter hartonius]